MPFYDSRGNTIRPEPDDLRIYRVEVWRQGTKFTRERLFSNVLDAQQYANYYTRRGCSAVITYGTIKYEHK